MSVLDFIGRVFRFIALLAVVLFLTPLGIVTIRLSSSPIETIAGICTLIFVLAVVGAIVYPLVRYFRTNFALRRSW